MVPRPARLIVLPRTVASRFANLLGVLAGIALVTIAWCAVAGHRRR